MELLDLLESWLATAGLSKKAVIGQITATHFLEGRPPTNALAYDMFAGRAPLTRAFLEFVEDVCFPELEAGRTQKRIATARELLEKVEALRQAAAAPQRPGASLELKLLDSYLELDRLRKAYLASEHQRVLAVQVALFAVQALQRTEVTAGDLRRELERLPATGTGHEPERLGHELRRAQDQIELLLQAGERAEKERTDALDVADRALRRIEELEASIALQEDSAGPDSRREDNSEVGGTQVLLYQADTTAQEMDAVDDFIIQARTLLDGGREAVEDAVHFAGIPTLTPPRDDDTLVLSIWTPPGDIPQLQEGTDRDHVRTGPLTDDQDPAVPSPGASAPRSAHDPGRPALSNLRKTTGVVSDFDVTTGLGHLTDRHTGSEVLLATLHPLAFGQLKTGEDVTYLVKMVDGRPTAVDVMPLIAPNVLGLSPTTLYNAVSGQDAAPAAVSGVGVRKVRALSATTADPPVAQEWPHLHACLIIIAVTAVLIAEITSGLTAALSSQPGPAIWKLSAFAVLVALVCVGIWLIAFFTTVMLGVVGEEGPPVALIGVFLWPLLGLFVGLVLPWMTNFNPWGHWLAQLLGTT